MRRIFIVGFCLVAVSTIGVFFLLYKKPPTEVPGKIVIPMDVPEMVTTQQLPEGWKEYQNIAYDFSLFFPKDFEVREYPEGGGSITVTFQNIQKGEGFQIFILPYTEAQVSEERFRKDIPSAVRTDLTDINVDGATGAAFYSKDDILGDTREVWFVHKGFLYEVTALREQEAWLSEIMETWRFI